MAAELTQLLKSVASPSLTKTSPNSSSGVFDVNNIKNAIDQYNVQRPSLGQAVIFVPPIVSQRNPTYNNLNNVLRLYAEAFNFPSMGVATNEIRRYGEGTLEQNAYAPLNVDLTFTFISDGRGIVHSFFYNWMNSMVRNDSRTLNGDIEGFTFPFEVAYKKGNSGYGTTIILTSYDEKGEPILTSVVEDAFPKFVSDVQMSWSSSNDLARISVTMTYSHFYNVYPQDLEKVIVSKQPNLSLVQTAVKAATAIQTISTLRKPKSVGDVLNITNNTANIIKSF